MAGGCIGSSRICSRGRLQEGAAAGFMQHLTAASFHPAERRMP
jgi:hypothetical protein